MLRLLTQYRAAMNTTDPARGWSLIVKLMTPAAPRDAQLRIEQLLGVARHMRSLSTTPITATVMAAICLQWVGPASVLPWLAAVIACGAIAMSVSGRALARKWQPGEAGILTLRMLAGAVPLTLIWPTLILFAWVKGDPNNNAVLLIFLVVSMVANVPLGGACLLIGLPAMAAYLPLMATHVIAHTPLMYWLATLLQISAGIYISDLTFKHAAIFRASVVERFAREDLASDLARALEEARMANSAKSAFLASMSHELRTPLNAIIGFSDLMNQGVFGPVSPARYAGYVTNIHDSGMHLLQLIADLLDISKIESGKREFLRETLDMAGISNEALAFVATQAQKNGVQLHQDIDIAAAPIADRRAMLQVITNLLSNAVKFTLPDGHVTIFVRAGLNGTLAVGVEDTGIGMSAAEVRTALEFYGQVSGGMTVEGHGTGLGLPICKALIEALGAQFKIESARNKGTCVLAEFPPERVAIRPAVQDTAAA